MTDQITHRRIANIAVPIVLSNITVPLLGLVDTGVIGQLGEAVPIGAVGIGALILTSIYWLFGFLRMGTIGLTAQALGAKNDDEVHALLTRVLLVAACAGLCIILSQSVLFRGAFWVSPASAEVETLAADYMAIRVWSAPAIIALYGITGWLVALERTKSVLVIQVVMNGLNIVLDFWFVVGMGWGIAGVAWATFAAEWVGVGIGLWFCSSSIHTDAWRKWALILDRHALTHMWAVNTDIMIRSILLMAIFVSFMFFASDLGDVPLAANQVLLQFFHLIAFALDGFAFAAETLVGQAVGARSVKQLRRSAIMTSQWGAGVAVVLAVGFAIGGGFAIDVMTTAVDVRQEARVYLMYVVAVPIFACAAFMLDGIFVGATRTRDMRNMMLISTAIYFAAVYPLMWSFGNHGLWLALLVSFVARGVTLAARYPRLEGAVTGAP